MLAGTVLLALSQRLAALTSAHTMCCGIGTPATPFLAVPPARTAGWRLSIGVRAAVGPVAVAPWPVVLAGTRRDGARRAGSGRGAYPMARPLTSPRTRTTAGSAALSAVARGVGYASASAGPLGFGLVLALTGSWAGAFVLLGCLLVALVAGVVAGRPRHLEDAPAPPRPVPAGPWR